MKTEKRWFGSWVAASLASAGLMAAIGSSASEAAGATPGETDSSCDLSSAADTETFVAYWTALGGEVAPEVGYASLLRRAGEGQTDIGSELAASYDGDEYVSMTLSAAGSAIEGGHPALAQSLLDQLEDLDEEQRVRYASLLVQLGETARGEELLAGLEDINNVSGELLLYFIDTLGVEEGIARLRRLSASPELGIYGAAALYEKRGELERRRELLASPQTLDSLTSEAISSLLIHQIGDTLGEQSGLEALAVTLDRMEELEPSSRQFHAESLVKMLARQGCSDACLSVAVEPIRAGAKTDPQWSDALRQALAATGDLSTVLAQSEETSDLFHSASEWAAGRGQPRYVLPLLAEMPDAIRAEQVAWMTQTTLWNRESDPALLAETIALAGPITDPAPWADVVGAIVHSSGPSEAQRLAVREQLVRSTTPGCFVPLEPQPVPAPLSPELEAERAALIAELEALDELPSDEPRARTELADAKAHRRSYRGVARCEGAVAVVTFDHSFDGPDDTGVVSSLRIAHGCSEEDELVVWQPRDEVELDGDWAFALRSPEGIAVEAWRTESGEFRGELADPGFTVTCEEVSRALCRAFDAAPVSPE